MGKGVEKVLEGSMKRREASEKGSHGRAPSSPKSTPEKGESTGRREREYGKETHVGIRRGGDGKMNEGGFRPEGGRSLPENGS